MKYLEGEVEVKRKENLRMNSEHTTYPIYSNSRKEMIDFLRNEVLELPEWKTSPSTLVQWMQKDLKNTSDRKREDPKSFQREKEGHLEKTMNPRIPPA